jgi:predicted DCC family thiol-disulfide oxidoreductase YuxK
VLYDGDCGICSAVAVRMQAAHGEGVATWCSWHGRGSLPAGVSEASLARSIALVTGSGRIERGFTAFRYLFVRTPGLRLLGVVSFVPGVGLLGRLVYAVVARNRMRISRALGLSACSLQTRPVTINQGVRVDEENT